MYPTARDASLMTPMAREMRFLMYVYLIFQNLSVSIFYICLNLDMNMCSKGTDLHVSDGARGLFDHSNGERDALSDEDEEAQPQRRQGIAHVARHAA